VPVIAARSRILNGQNPGFTPAHQGSRALPGPGASPAGERDRLTGLGAPDPSPCRPAPSLSHHRRVAPKGLKTPIGAASHPARTEGRQGEDVPDSHERRDPVRSADRDDTPAGRGGERFSSRGTSRDRSPAWETDWSTTRRPVRGDPAVHHGVRDGVGARGVSQARSRRLAGACPSRTRLQVPPAIGRSPALCCVPDIAAGRSRTRQTGRSNPSSGWATGLCRPASDRTTSPTSRIGARPVPGGAVRIQGRSVFYDSPRNVRAGADRDGRASEINTGLGTREPFL